MVKTHKHRSILAVLALAALVLFVIAGIVVAFDDEDKPEAEETPAVQVDDTEVQSILDNSQDAYFSGTAEDKTLAKKELETIAGSDAVTTESREEALNALADQCYLEGSITCLRDLRESYIDADLDPQYSLNLIESLEDFSTRYID